MIFDKHNQPRENLRPYNFLVEKCDCLCNSVSCYKEEVPKSALPAMLLIFSVSRLKTYLPIYIL